MASYGESGANQGLSRAQTRIRNQYIEADNSGDKKAKDRLRKAFKKSTGRNISEYVERR